MDFNTLETQCDTLCAPNHTQTIQNDPELVDTRRPFIVGPKCVLYRKVPLYLHRSNKICRQKKLDAQLGSLSQY